MKELIKEPFHYEVSTDLLTKCYEYVRKKKKSYRISCYVSLTKHMVSDEVASIILALDCSGNHYTFVFSEILELADKLGILDEYIKKHHQ